MREVKIGDKDYKVVASPITLFFYKKEFKKDLIGDLMGFQSLAEDTTTFDSITILQMAWAMIKTAKAGQMVGFEQWLNSLEYVNFEDSEMMTNVIEEATEGFFRTREQTPGQSTENTEHR